MLDGWCGQDNPCRGVWDRRPSSSRTSYGSLRMTSFHHCTTPEIPRDPRETPRDSRETPRDPSESPRGHPPARARRAAAPQARFRPSLSRLGLVGSRSVVSRPRRPGRSCSPRARGRRARPAGSPVLGLPGNLRSTPPTEAHPVASVLVGKTPKCPPGLRGQVCWIPTPSSAGEWPSPPPGPLQGLLLSLSLCTLNIHPGVGLLIFVF